MTEAHHAASCSVTRGEPCDCGAVKPPGKIRVLRVLEYTYDDAEKMADDIARWHVGAVGTVNHNRMSIKSATFLPEIEGE